MSIKDIVLGLCLSGLTLSAIAQKNYFVDGFHGGIYGHYPMWVTQFMVDSLKAYPEWRIGMEIEPETWDTVLVKDPSGYRSIQEWAVSERMDFTNPTYAQPYLYNISGESIIRQFSYGMAKHRKHFHNLQFTTYAVEEPCFTSSLPQILKQFGIQYAVLKCPNTLWGGYTRAFGGEILNWVGPDGTSILTVPRYESEALEENSTWQTTAWNNSINFIQSARNQGILNPVGMCYQDAGWKNGPWLGTGNQIKNGSTYLTWTEYFNNYAPKMSTVNWRLSQEDILVNLMWGSQVLQKIAQQVRQAENALSMVEKISTMAFMENGYQIEQPRLSEAWRTLMMAQHHDSWIVPYNRLNANQSWADAIKEWTAFSVKESREMILEAVKTSSKNKNGSKSSSAVRVYNTLGHERKELVRVDVPQQTQNIAVYDSHGNLVPSFIEHDGQVVKLNFVASVKGLAYATYRIAELESPQESQKSIRFDDQGNCIMENEHLRLKLDKKRGGVIKSLIAKSLQNKEYIQSDEEYSFNEISGHFFLENKYHSSKDHEVSFEILQDNLLEKRLAIKGQIAGDDFVQIISLKTGENRIDVDLKINWSENVRIGEYEQKHNWTDNRRAFTDDRYKLKVLFPTNLKQQQFYKNAPFDVTKSQLDSSYFGRWDDIKHNVILNWLDAYDERNQTGLAILTDHTSSYVHGPDMPIGLTAQYSGVGLWGMDYRITEPLHMKYALIPHHLNWAKSGISEQSNAWNEPLYAVYQSNINVENRQFIMMEDDGFEISALQEIEQEVKVRFYNANGLKNKQKIKINIPVKSLTEVYLDGRKVKDQVFKIKGNQTEFYLEIPQFGFKTLSIKR